MTKDQAFEKAIDIMADYFEANENIMKAVTARDAFYRLIDEYSDQALWSFNRPKDSEKIKTQ